MFLCFLLFSKLCQCPGEAKFKFCVEITASHRDADIHWTFYWIFPSITPPFPWAKEAVREERSCPTLIRDSAFLSDRLSLITTHQWPPTCLNASAWWANEGERRSWSKRLSWVVWNGLGSLYFTLKWSLSYKIGVCNNNTDMFSRLDI